MDRDTQRSPAVTPEAPAPLQAATTNRAASNADRQAALGLTPNTSPDGGGVSHALGDVIQELGDGAAVVLDAMPLAEALPLVFPLLAVPWAFRWLRSLEPSDVATLPAPLQRRLAQELLAAGEGVAISFEGRAAVAFGALLGGKAQLHHEAAGYHLRFDGMLLGTFGAGANATLSGVDTAVGSGASGTAEAGLEGVAEWLLPFNLPIPALEPLLLASLGGASARFSPAAIEAAVGSLAPTHLELGVCGGTEAGVDADSPLLPEMVGHLALAGLGRAALSSGTDEGRPYVHASWTTELSAAGFGEKAAGGSKTELEAWGRPEGGPGITRVKLTIGDTVGGDSTRESIELDSLDDAADLLGAATSAEKGAPVGALRLEREVTLEDPRAVADLIAPVAGGGLEADLFFAKAESRVTAEVALVVDDTLPAVPGLDSADPEARRDQQRALAAGVLGERYETAWVNPLDAAFSHTALVEAKVTRHQEFEEGAGVSATDVLKAGGAERAGVELTQTLDLTPTISISDVSRLLTA